MTNPMILLFVLVCGATALSAQPSGGGTYTPPANNAPNISVRYNTAAGSSSILVGKNDTLNVAYGDNLSAMNFEVIVTDGENDDCSLSASISGIGNTGLLIGEWSKPNFTPPPLILNPGSGTFNTPAGATHTVVLTADDATDQTALTFFIQQSPQPPNTLPALYLWDNSGPGSVSIGNLSTLNVNFGDTLASLNLAMQFFDLDGDDVSCTASIAPLGNTGLDETEWESVSAAVPYTLYPTAGTFNAVAGQTYQFDLIADDGRDQTGFTFFIQQAAQPAVPAPVLGVSDGAGTIAYNDNGTGTARDFGGQIVGTGPSAAVTITLSNTGNADLNLSGFAVSGEFVLDASNTAAVVIGGSSTSFTVSFNPASQGSHSAYVEFVHDDTTQTTPFRFEVVGVGLVPVPAPVIVVREGGSTGSVVANGAMASGLRNFGSVDIANMPSAAVTVHVENAGNADLVLGLPVSGSSDFVLDTTAFATVLTPGSSTSFQMMFSTTVLGASNASISFTHNDASTPAPFVVNVVATATTANGNVGGGASTGGGAATAGCVANADSGWLWAVCLLGVLGAPLLRRRSV